MWPLNTPRELDLKPELHRQPRGHASELSQLLWSLLVRMWLYRSNQQSILSRLAMRNLDPLES